jgi:hypothetical protein
MRRAPTAARASKHEQDAVGGRVEDLAHLASLMEMPGDPTVDPVGRAQHGEEHRRRDPVLTGEQQPKEQRYAREPAHRDEIR